MTTEAMRELATAVVERRNQIGLTQEDLANRGGPSTATIRQVETAAQDSYRPRTLFALDASLNWEQGTALRLARGETTAERVRLAAKSGPRDLEPPGTTEEDYVAAEMELPPADLFRALRAAPSHALIYELTTRLEQAEHDARDLEHYRGLYLNLLSELAEAEAAAEGGDGDADADDAGGSAPTRTYPSVVPEAARKSTKPED